MPANHDPLDLQTSSQAWNLFHGRLFRFRELYAETPTPWPTLVVVDRLTKDLLTITDIPNDTDEQSFTFQVRPRPSGLGSMAVLQTVLYPEVEMLVDEWALVGTRLDVFA